MKKKSVKDLFKRVKLLVLDVDGVLTRGEIIYDDRGREFKVFNVKDGLGVYLLSRLGIKTILLSARNSPILQRRAREMKAAEVIGAVLPKEKALEGIFKKYKVSSDEVCFIGDDLIDLGVIKAVGLGVAVNDAVDQVRGAAVYVTKNNGGQGAVREVADLIIRHKGLNKALLECLRMPSPKGINKG
jgi:3-deoxy-D-manno-octulosonate 8-phosphate phosphatase (KDO 8-P phosphatase)